MEQAADLARFVPDRRKREGEKRFFPIAVAGQEHPLVFEERRIALPRLAKGLADRRPGACPGDAIVLPESPGVSVAAHRAIPVVVDLGVLVAPDHVDREIRGEAKADGCLETLGPLIDRPERRVAPVFGSNELGHFAAAGQEVAGEYLLCRQPGSPLLAPAWEPNTRYNELRSSAVVISGWSSSVLLGRFDAAIPWHCSR